MNETFDELNETVSESKSNISKDVERDIMICALLDEATLGIVDGFSNPLLDALRAETEAFFESEKVSYKDKIIFQYALRRRLDLIVSMEKVVSSLHEMAQKKYVPEAMEDEGIEKIAISGVGTVYLQSDMYVSMNSERKEEAYQWLEDMGNGDLIKPTVNSSSLASLIRGMIKEGVEVPADLINVTPYTKAVIKTK